MPRILSKISILLMLPAVTLAAILIFRQPATHALTGADFQAGHIIDDAVFTDNSTMSVQDINNFLNAEAPTCDTSGSLSKSYYYNSSSGEVEKDSFSGASYVTTTRAIYGQRYDTWNGTTIATTPYVCLKDYRENPNTHQNNLQGATVSGGVTPGEIIYYAALAYHINPQVLLVTLQKEQGLITDDWPWTNEYAAAMGFDCPDDGTGCHSAYAGFTVQVNSAAAQLRNYLTNPGGFNFIAGQNNSIGYYPCNSGTTVFIQNAATAALYDYTPYQPDPDVLSNTNPTGSPNGPGSVSDGDTCATYGNRNFWWYFNTWFGSTYAINGSIQSASGLSLSPSGSSSYVNDSLTASYQVKNTASYSIDAGSLGVCATLNGQWYDFGFANDVIVPANGTITVSYSKKLTVPGNLIVSMCSYNPAFGWANAYYPYDINGGLSRQATLTVNDSPLITSGLILGPTNFAINQPVTAYLSIKNLSASNINIGSLVIAARDPNGNNVDFPIKNDVTIPAGGTTSNLTWTRTFTVPGNYTFYVAHWNGTWDTTYPDSASNAVVRQVIWPVLDNPLITSGISLSPSSPAKGQNVTATVTVRNVGSNPIDIGSLVVAGRDPGGNNVDFPIENDFTIPAASGGVPGTKTYSEPRSFSSSGAYRFYIAHWNGTWDTTYPKSIDNSVARQLTLTL